MRNIIIILIFISSSALSDVLKSSSFGGVQIGMNEKEALAHLKGYVSDKLSYEPPYNCYYLLPQSSAKGIHIMVESERVARFDVFDKELNITTKKGVGIGSTKSEVLRAYPKTKVSPHPYIAPEGEYLEVKFSNGFGIIFETDHDIVTSFRTGTYPALGYIEGCS